MNLVSLEYLRIRLVYCPITGSMTWKSGRCKSRIGKEAGTNHDGYRVVVLQGKMYRVHRLAWMLMTGEWPEHEIDHINLDRGDNRWVNLRAADKRGNACNTGIRADNKSGFKGVCWDKDRRKWRADIKLPHIRKHLGLFADPAVAHAAYAQAAKKFFGEFGRVS
jgi:hypothetical protein